MVCVPCFIIPLLLYIWHKFVQPILLRYWNPWEKKDAQGNVIKAAPEFPFECKGGVCPFVPPAGNKQQKSPPAAEGATSGAEEVTTSDPVSGDSDATNQTPVAESKKLI